MENIPIKSVTHCPTCGSECKVEGGTTQYYVPVKKYTERQLRDAMEGAMVYSMLKQITEYIISLNKQDNEN